MTFLDLILIAAGILAVLSVVAVVTWFAYTTYLNGIERRLAVRKGLYRDLVAGLAQRDRALLEPVLHQISTLRDFDALEAVLEEQARSATERPQWLLDAYDRLGLVDKYIGRLRHAKQWRERAFSAELLGRVGNAKAVPVLLETIQATRAEDADVREIALRALARIGDPRAVVPLVEALKKAEVWLAPRIADILARHGELSVDPMIAFLQEPTQHPARAWAANILGEVRAARAFPALVRALDDLDDEVRAKAAASLGKLGDRRAITYLLDHLLTDPAPFVRARIAGALGQFSDTDVIDTLVRALGDPAWWVRMRSVEALEQIGPIAEGPLMLALDDTDPEIRIRAAVALERLGVPNRIIGQIEAGSSSREAIDILTKFGLAGARELLAEQLQHHSPLVREVIINAIQQAGRRDLGQELVLTALEDQDAGIRALAFEALRNLGLRSAVPAALDGLGDTDQHVRTAAMRLIGELGEAEVAGMIRPRTADHEPMVRAAAARALGQIHATDAQPELARLLRDPVAEVRAAAADGVADGHATWATQDLINLLGDADAGVRLTAARGLGRLGDQEALPALLRSFQTGSAELREVIADSVARLDIEAVPSLLDILFETRELEARKAIVRILAQVPSDRAASLLQQLWKDVEPEVRRLVVDGMAQTGSPHTADLLVEGLEDPDEIVRARSLDAIARLGLTDAGGKVLDLLSHDPDPSVRERAALAAGLLLPQDGEEALLAACHSDQPLLVRAAAAVALGAYDRESIVARVLEMLDEEPVREHLRNQLRSDPVYRLIRQRLHEARQVELRALSTLNREQMEASLVEGMRGVLEPSERVRLVAAIRAFQGERSRRALLYAVRSDPSPDVRAAALNAVSGMLEAEELFLLARRAITDPNQGVRRVAVQLLTRIPPDQALPMIMRILPTDDEDPEILRAVAEHAETAFEVFVDLALGLAEGRNESITVCHVAEHVHHRDLPRLLQPVSRSRFPEVREALATLWFRRPDLIEPEALARYRADPVAAVRIAAARATARAGDFDSLGILLEDPDPDVRRAAVLELRLTTDGPGPEPLLKDSDETVRAGAWTALLLRGEPRRLPAGVGSELVARTLREVTVLAELQITVRTDPESRKRITAGIALALLGDPLARDAAQYDPLPEVRQAIGAVLEKAVTT
ncbi:MAG: HEAT repeat domain-containing protein [Gemmatimonadales bacterium]